MRFAFYAGYYYTPDNGEKKHRILPIVLAAAEKTVIQKNLREVG
jgi:hypothetical protein